MEWLRMWIRLLSRVDGFLAIVGLIFGVLSTRLGKFGG
jgi:hypothetical protein